MTTLQLMSQLKQTVQWASRSAYMFLIRPVSSRQVRYLGITALIAGAMSVSVGFSVQGTNTIEKSVDGFVCNVHHVCGPVDENVTTLTIPAAGNYAVYVDIDADSGEKQLNESVYITFSQNSSTITPNNPNAGDYRVMPDLAGVKHQEDAYAGTFTFAAGDTSLNVYHYGLIWDAYPAFYKDSPAGKTGPESVDVTNIKLVHIPDDSCTTNQAPVAVIDPTNVVAGIGDTVSLNALSSTDADGDSLAYTWKIDGTTVGTNDSITVPSSSAGEYTVTLAVADQCESSETNTIVDIVENPEGCELVLTKNDRVEWTHAGDQLTYDIHVENVGTSNCTGGGVEMLEFYDAQTTFVNSTPAPNANDDYWNLDTVTPGEGRDFVVTVRVSDNAQPGDVIHNEACVWAAEYGPRSEDSSWVCDTEDTPIPDGPPTGPTCGLYGVHDAGSSDSQFFYINENGSMSYIGGEYNNHDIEAIDIHPTTGVLYAISGNGGSKNGNVYIVNKTTGALTQIGHTGLSGDEIVSASFHPNGTLWAYRENVGLYTINLSNGAATLQWNVSGVDDNWEGLTWDLTGTYLYGADGNELFRWNPSTQSATTLCTTLPKPTEALEMRPDGVLIGGHHGASNPNEALFEINTNSCSISPANYAVGSANDIESLAFDICEPTDPCEGHVDPVAVIDPTTSEIFLGDTQSFKGTDSTDADGDTLSYTWTIDGTSFNSSNSAINYTPANLGEYTVNLTVADQCGEDTTTAVVKVKDVPDQCEGNTAPVADIAPETKTITIGDSVTFDGTGTVDADGDSLSYLWTVVDKGITGTGTSLGFTPTSTGTYIIELTVADECSEHTESAILIVEDKPDQCIGNNVPVADITPKNETITLGDGVTFDSAGTTDADGDTLTFAWSIDNTDIVDSGATLGFTPTTTGTYIIRLTAADQCSNDDTSTTLIVEDEPDQCVLNTAPVADITPKNETITLGDSVTFDSAGTTDADGDTLTFGWDIENTDIVQSGSTLGFTPTTTGTYVINLSAADQCTTDTTSTTLIVEDEPDQCVGHVDPAVVISPEDAQILLGESITFTSANSSDADGDTVNFVWSVSNTVDTFTTETITLTPTSTGLYVITLAGSDQCGGATSETTLRVIDEPGVCIDDQLPIADAGPDFAANQDQLFTLDGTASYDPDGDAITSYHWTIDQIPSFSANTATTSLSVTEKGHYTARLTVGNQCSSADDIVQFEVVGGGGCTGPHCNQCLAGVAPIAVAGDDMSVAVGETFTLDGTGSSDPEGEALRYKWTISSTGFTANTAVTTTSISSPGKYVAVLNVNDACNVDSDELIIDVTGGGGQCIPNGLPVAVAGPDFTITAGKVATLSGSGSFDPDGDTLSYFWEIPSIGFTSVNKDVAFVIDQVGEHTAILSVRDQCSLDSDELKITVTTPPTVLGTSTTSFIPPTESPRAGGMPMAAAAAGTFTGFLTAAGAWISMKRRTAQDGLVNFINR